jgi:hypothetical protein
MRAHTHSMPHTCTPQVATRAAGNAGDASGSSASVRHASQAVVGVGMYILSARCLPSTSNRMRIRLCHLSHACTRVVRRSRWRRGWQNADARRHESQLRRRAAALACIGCILAQHALPALPQHQAPSLRPRFLEPLDEFAPRRARLWPRWLWPRWVVGSFERIDHGSVRSVVGSRSLLRSRSQHPAALTPPPTC